MNCMKKLQRGIALISVMLIVALASILITKMTGKLIMQMQRTANVTFNQQAYWYALGAEAFAANVLKSTFDAEPDVTHLGQFWAQGETSYPVEQGQITGEIFDLQACFNLNALRITKKKKSTSTSPTPTPDPNAKPPARASFERLLIALEIDGVDEFSAEYLADALTDWLDKDSTIASAGGAEDSDYAGRAHPYLAANNLLASVTELRTIEHFTPLIIEAITPYVCVIPDSNLHEVNINTIDEESKVLLQALLDISAEDASDVISDRGEDGFDKVDDIWKVSSIANAKLSDEQKKQFAVDSKYFKLKTLASFNDSYIHLNTVFMVSKNKSIEVIARSLGRN